MTDMTENVETTPTIDTVTPAPAKRKASTNGKGKASTNGKGKAVKGKAAAAVKPTANADQWLSSYPNLKKWPKAAGPAPTRLHIATARALNIWRGGTKHELAVAAYCRDDATEYSVKTVAVALQCVLGGVYNPIMNAVNADIDATYGYGKAHKVKVGTQTAYRVEFSAKGRAKVDKYFAENGLPANWQPGSFKGHMVFGMPATAGKGTADASKPVQATNDPAAETATSDAATSDAATGLAA
jgi:hypothetical protein